MSTPQARPELALIPRYVAGRPPAARPGVTAYKLSSNENPFPPLPEVLEAIARAAATTNRYPDMGSARLLDALAVARGVPREDIAVGTGSSALIYALLSAYAGPGTEVVHPWRSFEAYPIAVSAAGATGVPVPNLPDGTHDVDGLVAAVTPRTRALLLCSPNNPTGPALAQADLERVLASVPGDVLVVLDEAYAEFVRRPDAAHGLTTYDAHPNLVVLRTFSKAHGLAGLRVGYAVGRAELLDPVRAILLPFGVSAVAEAAAVASLAAEDALLERVAAIVAKRDKVVAGMRERGWQVPDAQGNFFWLPMTGERLTGFVEAAEAAGITVRPLGGEGVRVTIGESEANERVLRLAGGLVAAGGHG
jgi:histidinol-phosphate aminotransferase